MTLERRLDIAMKREPADLVIKNVRIFHLNTGEFETGDIAIADGIIAGIGSYSGLQELEGSGLTAVPGFIDAHMHLESSMLQFHEFEKLIIPHGVTTVFCDPHELANVIGTAAFEVIQEYAQQLSLDLRLQLSSCVPATDMETSGATITAQDLAAWHEKSPASGLAEMMNAPGVFYKDPEVIKKISLFSHIDGHCPLLSGNELNAYIAAGISNDHECSSLEEAREKLRRDMNVLIREGSAARNFDSLHELMTLENSMSLAFCADDRNPMDIIQSGHIDSLVKRAIALGCSPLVAYRVASLSAARIMGLYDRGLIAPGQRADILLLRSLEQCDIAQVIVHGQLVNDAVLNKKISSPLLKYQNTVHCKKVTAADFFIPPPTEGTPIIGIHDGLLLTDFLRYPQGQDDIATVAVLERHGKNGNIARAYVHGFGIKKGAIASSVGHDSHNLCVVGSNPEDMAVAINALRDAQGGLAVAVDGKTTGLVSLSIAGLISNRPLHCFLQEFEQLRQALKDTGITVAAPFMQLSFIPLPVIPFLKLTDKGLVDVQEFKLITP